MPAIESTYGAKLANAYTLLAIIENLPNYNSASAELTPSEFRTFLGNVAATNQQLATAENNNSTAASARRLFFKKGPDCLINKLTLIKASAVASFGKKSNNVAQIASIIKDMRSAAPVEYILKSSDPNVADKIVSQSQSQLSYGSIQTNFSNLVSKLASMPGYHSPNPDLSIAKLQDLIQNGNDLNSAADNALTIFKNTQQARTQNYETLSERAQRIVATVLALASRGSAAFKSASKLKF